MESYGYRERKKGGFFKYTLIILSTIAITLYVNNAVQKANEIDDFAKKLSDEENTPKQKEITEFNLTKASNYIERAMQSTVGIGLIKPSGTSVFDLDLARKWGLRNRNNSIRKRVYTYQSTFGTKGWGKNSSNTKFWKISARQGGLERRKHRFKYNKNRGKRIGSGNIRRFK